MRGQGLPVCEHYDCAANWCNRWRYGAETLGGPLSDAERAAIQMAPASAGPLGVDANGSPVEAA